MYTALRAQAKAPATPDVTVCLVRQDRRVHDDDARMDPAIAAAATRPECKGENAEITAIHTPEGRRFLILGLGEASKLDAEKVRAAGSALVKTLHKMHAATAHLRLHAEGTAPLDAATFGRALGEGLGLGALPLDGFKGTTKKKAAVDAIALSTSDPLATKALEDGLDLAECANVARRLAATPPNIATTTFIAARAKELAKENGLTCTIIEGAALEKNKLVGLINVGKAAAHPPCLIQLVYTPKKKPTATLLLVGKTICYDSGGLSIKPKDGMRGMKYDKSGGMAVLGAMQAIARRKPSCKVIGLLPTAENSIAGNAYRVDDIIHYPNGVTVEVTNTDAEGRLVLADALIHGVKAHKPDAVIDLATLTGGVVVALGSTYAGYFCEDAGLRAKMEAASASTGERLWRLPMHTEYNELMKAKQADIWNSAPVRDAHPIQGAAFLNYFVDAALPWAHVDIAGTADIDKDRPPFSPGPTGFGVRLLTELVMNWK